MLDNTACRYAIAVEYRDGIRRAEKRPLALEKLYLYKMTERSKHRFDHNYDAAIDDRVRSQICVAVVNQQQGCWRGWLSATKPAERSTWTMWHLPRSWSRKGLAGEKSPFDCIRRRYVKFN